MSHHSLNLTIDELYAQMSFERGERPDWNRARAIFAPGARLVRINDDGVFEFTLDAFTRDFETMIDTGTMPSFWEGELWRDTFVMGNMAHVLSAYEMRRERGGEIVGRAMKSIQLFRRDKSDDPNRWWISAMIWRRESANARMPERRS